MASNNQLYEPEEGVNQKFMLEWSKPVVNGFGPCARGGHTMIFADNQLIIFGGHYFGGAGSFVYLNDTFAFDLENSTWHEVRCGEEIPPPRYNHTASLVGSRMFIFGGRSEKGKVLKDMYFLDLEEWSWHSVNWTTDSPAGRFGHSELSVGNKIVVFGGWNGKKCFQDLWVFDTEAFTWMEPKTGQKPPKSRQGHTSVLLHDGKIVVFGGFSSSPNENPEYHADTRVLDTETMMWERPRISGDYPGPRFGHSMCLAGDSLFLLGGWGGTEKFDICKGDKILKDEAKQKAREERLKSGYKPASRMPVDLVCTSRFLHVLNTRKMEWRTPVTRGIRVTNRYGHQCALVGPHIFMFGGWDGNRALGELLVAEILVHE